MECLKNKSIRVFSSTWNWPSKKQIHIVQSFNYQLRGWFQVFADVCEKAKKTGAKQPKGVTSQQSKNKYTLAGVVWNCKLLL